MGYIKFLVPALALMFKVKRSNVTFVLLLTCAYDRISPI